MTVESEQAERVPSAILIISNLQRLLVVLHRNLQFKIVTSSQITFVRMDIIVQAHDTYPKVLGLTINRAFVTAAQGWLVTSILGFVSARLH